MGVTLKDVIVWKDTYRDIATGTESAQSTIEKDAVKPKQAHALSERTQPE